MREEYVLDEDKTISRRFRRVLLEMPVVDLYHCCQIVLCPFLGEDYTSPPN